MLEYICICWSIYIYAGGVFVVHKYIYIYMIYIYIYISKTSVLIYFIGRWVKDGLAYAFDSLGACIYSEMCNE